MKRAGALEFNRIHKNVEIQHSFGKEKIAMLAGGTRIIPIMDALHAILGTTRGITEATLIHRNMTPQDTMCGSLGAVLQSSWRPLGPFWAPPPPPPLGARGRGAERPPHAGARGARGAPRGQLRRAARPLPRASGSPGPPCRAGGRAAVRAGQQ